MPISIECPACGRRLKANDALAGRHLPCSEAPVEGGGVINQAPSTDGGWEMR
jgi:hypothetical protein